MQFSHPLKKFPPEVQFSIATQESIGAHLASVGAVILTGLYPGEQATQPIPYPQGFPAPSSEA
ncbi:MAG: hypothetical protein DHS20C13_26570 [Thermodesulfobacteriota bacterium]|nr:MAG: hypothetical protein DHS20C13_26570 [Thermodesulfobacteriota bacterium]